MFKKILLILISIPAFFLCEFFFYNMVNENFVPDLLLLSVIFFTFFFGIRYGVSAAVLAGVMKDSFNIGFFGFHILGFVVCALVTVSLRKIIYYSHSWHNRMFFVLIICLINFFIQMILTAMFDQPAILESLKFIFIPGALSTVLISSIFFKQLKKCALKFFV